jgi:hypothetical protein
MGLLDPPRCPQCNCEIAMEEFWRVAPKQSKGNFLSGSAGIVCPVCGVKLRVLQGRVVASWALALGAPLIVFAILDSLSPVDHDSVSGKIRLIAFLAILGGSFVLQWRWTPRLLRLRFVNDGETVEYPLVMRARELAAEAELEEKLAKKQLELESPDVGKPAWACAKCREENPGNFDICWKCQTVRPAGS